MAMSKRERQRDTSTNRWRERGGDGKQEPNKQHPYKGNTLVNREYNRSATSLPDSTRGALNLPDHHHDGAGGTDQRA